MSGFIDAGHMNELRAAVYSAPDYAAAHAEVDRCYEIERQAHSAYVEASARIDAIWDRESIRLFGTPIQK